MQQHIPELPKMGCRFINIARNSMKFRREAPHRADTAGHHLRACTLRSNSVMAHIDHCIINPSSASDAGQMSSPHAHVDAPYPPAFATCLRIK